MPCCQWQMQGLRSDEVSGWNENTQGTRDRFISRLRWSLAVCHRNGLIMMKYLFGSLHCLGWLDVLKTLVPSPICFNVSRGESSPLKIKPLAKEDRHAKPCGGQVHQFLDKRIPLFLAPSWPLFGGFKPKKKDQTSSQNERCLGVH